MQLLSNPKLFISLKEILPYSILFEIFPEHSIDIAVIELTILWRNLFGSFRWIREKALVERKIDKCPSQQLFSNLKLLISFKEVLPFWEWDLSWSFMERKSISAPLKQLLSNLKLLIFFKEILFYSIPYESKIFLNHSVDIGITEFTIVGRN